MTRELKVGIFSILIIVCAVLGYQFIRGSNPLGGDRVIKAKFDDVDQLAVSAPVLMRGVQVGTVVNRYFDPLDANLVIVEMAIKSEFGVPKDAVASLEDVSLVGGKLIKIVFDQACQGDECVQSGDLIQGKSPNIIASMIGEENIDALGRRVKRSFQKAFTDSSSSSDLMTNLEVLSANLVQLTKSLNASLPPMIQSLQSNMNSMNSVVGNLSENNASISAMFKNLEKLSANLSSINTNETADLANNSLRKVEGSIETLNNTLQTSKDAITKLDDILAQLNTNEGTMGKFLHDEELYNNLNQTNRELQLLLQDFRLNPKRYVNVSVFGKKQKEYQLAEQDPAHQK